MNFTGTCRDRDPKPCRRCLGIACSGESATPSGLGRGSDRCSALYPTPAGDGLRRLNDLGGCGRIRVQGKDVLPGLSANHEVIRLEGGPDVHLHWFGDPGVDPNEDLYYDYNNRDAVRETTGCRSSPGDLAQRASGSY